MQLQSLWVFSFYIVFSGFEAKAIVYKYVLGCVPLQLWFHPMLFCLFLLVYVVFRKYRPSEVGLIVNVLISIGRYILSTIRLINVLQLVTAIRYTLYYYFGAFLYENKTKFRDDDTEHAFLCRWICIINSTCW